MSPRQLEEVVALTMAHRRSEAPFDVVIEGQTPGEDPECDLEVVDGYRCAGLTWWIEKTGWFRGPLGTMRQRIDAGPPRASSPDPGARG